MVSGTKGGVKSKGREKKQKKDNPSLFVIHKQTWMEKWNFEFSETGVATPTKIGVYACDINAYLHNFFESIPIN